MHVGKQSSVILATKRLAGVALEMNLREHISHTPLPSVNKAAHSGFETWRRCHQKSKTGVSVAPQKGFTSGKILKKKVVVNEGYKLEICEKDYTPAAFLTKYHIYQNINIIMPSPKSSLLRVIEDRVYLLYSATH